MIEQRRQGLMHYMIGMLFNLWMQKKISSYLYKYHKIADDGSKKTRVNDLAVLSSVQLWFIILCES